MLIVWSALYYIIYYFLGIFFYYFLFIVCFCFIYWLGFGMSESGTNFILPSNVHMPSSIGKLLPNTEAKVILCSFYLFHVHLFNLFIQLLCSLI